MPSSAPWSGSRTSPSLAELEAAGLRSGSIKRFPRIHPLSSLKIPFTNVWVGIQTIVQSRPDAFTLSFSGHLVSARTILRHQTQNGRKDDQEETCSAFLYYGGGSATGSGRTRAGNIGRTASCAQDRKWIPSVAAIVAPHTCDCG